MKPALTARDFEHYVGIPWQDGGRTHAGTDCWGLARLVYHEMLGIELPAYSEDYTTALDRIIIRRLIDNKPDYWVRVTDPQVGDGVVFHVGTRAHVGVVVGSGRMLHIDRSGAVIESYESLRFSTQIDGFYRYNDEAA